MWPWKYLFLLLLPYFSFAQITHRDLLQKNCNKACLQKWLISQSNFHPFTRRAEEWKHILPDSIIQQLLNVGEQSLKGNFPNIPATVTLDFVRNGNRTRYENISFGKRNQLWNLLLAESIEGKNRFLDPIVDGIWSICEESFWGTSAHLFIQKAGKGLPDVEEPVVDLFAAEAAANLALADYFLGEKLDSISPLIRKRIYYEVNRRVFIPMVSGKWDWMGRGDNNVKLNNWAPWIMSNYLTAVLFLEKDSAKRIEYVMKTMQITDQYMNGIGEDGGSEEGPHYWAFGAGAVFNVLNLLSSATNGHVNIFNENMVRNMATYIYRIHIDGNYFVNVADSHPEESPEPIMIWRFGQAIKDANLSALGLFLLQKNGFRTAINPTFHRIRSLYDLNAFREMTASRDVFRENEGGWLPSVETMTARTANGFFVSAHGGNNGESHNHNDVGDFILYYQGEPVIIDVGSGTYTARTFSSERYKIWFNSSPYHNLPTINGESQSEGKQYAAKNISYKKNREVAEFSLNLENAYPRQAAINRWKRMIRLSNDHVTMTDSFVAAKSLTSLTQSFMTVCDANIDQPGIIVFTTQSGKKVSLEYDRGWSATKETMPLVTEEEQGLKMTWRGRSITRILLTCSRPGVSGNFRYNFRTLK